MARGPSRIGLNETQVGLAVPDAIQQLMRRVVGTYRAERLIVSGAMIDSETAERIGLVDELTDAEHVAVRAAHWLEDLLKLPRAPMLATRAIARADMIKALDDFSDADLGRFLEQWDSPDTQAAMGALMARLKKSRRWPSMDETYRPNWWSRNWKWFVPVGCLSTLVLFVGGIVLLMSFVFGMMKSTDVYSQALKRAKADPQVVSALGSPITDGYFTSGSIQESGPSGTAELSIPISGPKGSGTIYLEARKSTGQWSFNKLVVEIEHPNQRIDLLTESEKSATSVPLSAEPDDEDDPVEDLGQSSSI
jgi:hypothetical protein